MLFLLAESKGGNRVIRILYRELEIGLTQANVRWKKRYLHCKRPLSSLLLSTVLNKATTDAATSNLFPREEEATFSS